MGYPAPTEDVEARRERMGQAEAAVRFRSILERTSDDQKAAIRAGYSSVEQLAIDELGRAYHELLARIDRLETDVRTFLDGELVPQELRAEDKDEIVERVVERLRG